MLHSDADLAPPRAVHPSFFGCFDWHSAVHTHWLLVRLLRAHPDLPLRDEIAAALAASLAPANVDVEAAYLERHRAFERPYGLAWLALLVAEIAETAQTVQVAQSGQIRSGSIAPSGESAVPEATGWARALEPLARVLRANVLLWLARLRYPVRSGTHNQTAFALGLLLDAARATGDAELSIVLEATARRCYGADRGATLRGEPSGEDFLSPALMEADLMRRVLDRAAFTAWLDAFLPGLPPHDGPGWLDCGEVLDERDGKLVHLHGLNLSRAWSLENLAGALAAGDARRALFLGAAERHRTSGVRAALTATDYASTHWLPTFVVYLMTRRGAG